MNELKKRTMEVITSINTDWVTALKDAEEKEKGIDLSEMMGKFVEHMKRLDNFFQEATERVGSKKKGWLG